MEWDSNQPKFTAGSELRFPIWQRHIFVLLSIWGLLARDSGLQGREGVWGGRVADGDRIRGQIENG